MTTGLGFILVFVLTMTFMSLCRKNEIIESQDRLINALKGKIEVLEKSIEMTKEYESIMNKIK